MNEEQWKEKFSHAAKSGQFSVVLDKKADQYLSYFLEYFKPYGDALQKGRLLEMGCGVGDVAYLLAKQGFEVHGVDFVPEMIRAAEETYQHPNLHFAVANIYSLPFPEEFFDYIVCLGVFQTVIDEVRALEELSRVLKKRGVLIIRTLNKRSLTSFLVRNLHVYDPFQFSELLKRSGFNVKEVRAVYVFPKFLTFLSFLFRHVPFLPFLAHSFYLEARKA